MLIDAYGAYDGCKKAILDYSARHDLSSDIREIDDTGVWCPKPARAGNKPAAARRPWPEAVASTTEPPTWGRWDGFRSAIWSRSADVAVAWPGVHASARRAGGGRTVPESGSGPGVPGLGRPGFAAQADEVAGQRLWRVVGKE